MYDNQDSKREFKDNNSNENKESIYRRNDFNNVLQGSEINQNNRNNQTEQNNNQNNNENDGRTCREKMSCLLF